MFARNLKKLSYSEYQKLSARKTTLNQQLHVLDGVTKETVSIVTRSLTEGVSLNCKITVSNIL